MKDIDLWRLISEVDGEGDVMCRYTRKLLARLGGDENRVLDYPYLAQQGEERHVPRAPCDETLEQLE